MLSGRLGIVVTHVGMMGRGRMLLAVLQSLAEQSEHPFNPVGVVVAADGKNKNGARVACEFNTMYLQLPQRTFTLGTAARELGASWMLSQGAEWIWFVDDDVFPSRNALAVFGAADLDSDLIVARVRHFHGDKLVLKPAVGEPQYSIETSSLLISADLIRKIEWEHLPGERERDQWLYRQLLSFGPRVQYLDDDAIVAAHLAGSQDLDPAHRPQQSSGVRLQHVKSRWATATEGEYLRIAAYPDGRREYQLTRTSTLDTTQAAAWLAEHGPQPYDPPPITDPHSGAGELPAVDRAQASGSVLPCCTA